MRKSIFVLLIVSLFIFFGCDRSDDGGNAEKSARGIFALTDSPHEELSVLQVELTELKIMDTLGNEVTIFSEADGETFILNLLDLQEMNELLGTTPLPEGLYKQLSLSYKNAVALDIDGNVLTVRPQHYGTAKVVLSDPVVIEGENVYFEIDFDLNNSVYEIVSGPQGSILLMPTLVLRTYISYSDVELDEFTGVVQSVESMSLVMTINEAEDSDTINVVLTDTTIVEVDEIVTMPSLPGFDLTALIFAGNLVEVKGTLDIETNTVTATKIERKFENQGLESQGLIVGLGDSAFDLLVLDAMDSGFELGSIQTILYTENTFFVFTDVYELATAEQLALGQEVRVTGLSEDASQAQKVKLRETKMIGTVASINSGAGQITMNVTTIEGISVDSIPGFTNPVTVEFDGEFPAAAAVDAEIKVCGHFNRTTIGVFTALECEIEEDDEDLDGDDEDGLTTVVGKTFSVISSSPLKISITRGQGQGNVENRTITVQLAADGVIFEKDRSTTTIITPDALVTGINSSRYDQLKAHGTFNSTDRSLTASKIRADVKKK